MTPLTVCLKPDSLSLHRVSSKSLGTRAVCLSAVSVAVLLFALIVADSPFVAVVVDVVGVRAHSCARIGVSVAAGRAYIIAILAVVFAFGGSLCVNLRSEQKDLRRVLESLSCDMQSGIGVSTKLVITHLGEGL